MLPSKSLIMPVSPVAVNLWRRTSRCGGGNDAGLSSPVAIIHMTNPTDPLKKMRILVENRHGALLKIVGVFTTRAYNIITLNVMPDEDEELSQMTVSLRCSNVRFDQLRKQLIKIVDVVDVVE